MSCGPKSGTAAAVDLWLLYVLTEWLRLHYLLSAVLAFIVAFFVSFILQKFWTFGDHSTDKLHSQAALYFVVAALNLLLNTLLLYFFVDVMGFWYIFAQILASGLIACESFFISRSFIFRARRTGGDIT